MSKRIVYWQKTMNGYELTFAFDERVVNKIKSTIPSSGRSYSQSSRSWMIFRQTDFEKLKNASNAWIEFRRLEDDKPHTPSTWVPANQRKDYVDPLARENRRRT